MAKATRAPNVPAGLGAKAQKFWRDTHATYGPLRIDEVALLEDACRELDLIARLEAELLAGELIVQGSQGQPVANPMVQELRAHRGVLARLLKQLDFPDEDESGKVVRPSKASRSSAARAAAQARWRRSA